MKHLIKSVNPILVYCNEIVHPDSATFNPNRNTCEACKSVWFNSRELPEGPANIEIPVGLFRLLRDHGQITEKFYETYGPKVVFHETVESGMRTGETLEAEVVPGKFNSTYAVYRLAIP